MPSISLLSVLDKPDEAVQGKNKNLTIVQKEQREISMHLPETIEFTEAEAANRAVVPNKAEELIMAATGKKCSFVSTPDIDDPDLCDEDRYNKFIKEFSIFVPKQLVRDYDGECDNKEVVRLNPLLGGNIEFTCGAGLLNFLYADFDKAYASVQVNCEAEKESQEFVPQGHSEQLLYDYLCLAQTIKRFRNLTDCSLYTMAFPPIMRHRTKKELSAYFKYLKALQQKLADLIEFCFDEDYYPEVLKDFPTEKRLSLYCHIHKIPTQQEYTYIFGTHGTELHSLLQNILPGQLFSPDDEREEYSDYDAKEDFLSKYKITRYELELFEKADAKTFDWFQCSTIEEMLMFEFWQMIICGVKLRKCKRCSKYFIMKGNYDTNYCDRIAEGETRNCQDLAAQENYKKKMADNAAISMYSKYYKRYAARVRVRQIKEPDFKKWKYQAMTKRDECTDGRISLDEFDAWLEASFPNRKKKK